MNYTKYITFLLIPFFALSQKSNFDSAKLEEQKKIIQVKTEKRKEEKKSFLKNTRWKLIENNSLHFTGLVNGFPFIIEEYDAQQRNLTNTDLLGNNTISGIAVDGSGMKVYVWDGARSKIRDTHEAIAGRITNNEPSSHSNLPDSDYNIADHAGAVASVISANPPIGANQNATGHAPNVDIEHYDFFNDELEMVDEAGANTDYLVSNHSYGSATGWFPSNSIDADGDGTPDPGWYWLGYPDLDQDESALFGFYSDVDEEWDGIAFNAPHFTMVKAAGNDRDDYPPNVTSHWHLDINNNWVQSNDSHRGDCGNDGSEFDCIIPGNLGKNIIILGSNLPLTTADGRYSSPSDIVGSIFSSKGPTDDGRIKPDFSGIGSSVRTIRSSSDNAYQNAAGTSFSAPSVAGVIVLLQQIYNNLTTEYMTSDLVRTLLAHTTNEAGNANGPDYEFGWGTINALNAAQVLVDSDNETAILNQNQLDENQVTEFFIKATGTSPIKATIAWIDPPYNSPENLTFNNRTPTLVNDLDLRILDANNTEYFPWVLDVENPSSPATKGDNLVDNIEQVIVDNPTEDAVYRVRVSHKNELENDLQNYTLIITGAIEDDSELSVEIFPNPAENTLNIRYRQNFENGVYKIFDSKGVYIRNGKLESIQSSINVSELNSGIYSIQFDFDGKKINKRFIKR